MSNKGIKHDKEKEPLDLIPYEALKPIAEVLAFGARKYARGNFAKGLEFSRLISASLRHINQYNSGEDLDPESGLNHIAHGACMLVFLLYMQKHRPDLDDRWNKLELSQRNRKPELKDLVKGAKFKLRDGTTITIVRNAQETDTCGYIHPFADNGFYYGITNNKHLNPFMDDSRPYLDIVGFA